MISRIPDPDFVACVDCRFRRMVKTFSEKRVRRIAFCVRVVPYRRLRGQKGCDKGVKKKWAI